MQLVFLLIAYIAIFWAIGYFAFRAMGAQTSEEFFLAGRNLGVIPLAGSTFAAFYSSWMFLGAAGYGYTHGWGWAINIITAGCFPITLYLLLGKRLWLLGQKHNYMTIGDFIHHRFENDKLLAALVSVMVIVFVFPRTLMQFTGMARLLETMTDGFLSFQMGVVVFAAGMVVYLLFGGLRAVSYTDVFQGFLMFGLMIGAFTIITNRLGGFSAGMAASLQAKPGLFSLPGAEGWITRENWFSQYMINLIGQLLLADYWSLSFSAKDLGKLKKSGIIASAGLIVFAVIIISIGVLGAPVFPGLSPTEADNILPKMLAKYLSPFLVTLIMSGAFAAAVSTADSVTLGGNNLVTTDLYGRLVAPKSSPKDKIKFGRIFILVWVLISVYAAMSPAANKTVIFIGALSGTGLLGLTAPVIASLWWRGATRVGMYVGVIGGQIVTWILYFGKLSPLGFNPAVWGFFASAGLFVLGSLLSPKTPEKILEEIHGFVEDPSRDPDFVQIPLD